MPRTLRSILAVSLVLASGARAEPAPEATQNRTGTVIPGLRPASPREPIRLQKIRVIQETPWSLLLELTYVYEGKVPAGELKLVVLPDMPYWMSNPAPVARGRNVVRVGIDLYEKKLKEDGRKSYASSNLRVSFDHYAPKGFKGPIQTELVPFVKTWAPRD